MQALGIEWVNFVWLTHGLYEHSGAADYLELGTDDFFFVVCQ